MSSDPDGRLIAHNHPKNKGWTGKFQPWTIFHREEFQNKKEALAREAQLKSFQGRTYLRNILQDK